MVKKIIPVFLAIGLLFGWASPSWAPSDSTTMDFVIILSSSLGITLITDTNSAAPSAVQVSFDKYDDQDNLPPDQKPDAGFMYAPYRSLSGKNWHLARMIANGAGSMSLKVSANVTGITSDKIAIFFGGFYREGQSTPVEETKSKDWEPLNGEPTKSAGGPFAGVCPFNYQLSVSQLTSGNYSGTIVYTLTQ